jgi:DNA-binding protein YbaB
VLVVTSEAALTALGLKGVGWRRPTTYRELAATLAGPGWGIAVNPHLPIGAFAPIDEVARLARGESAPSPVGPPVGAPEEALSPTALLGMVADLTAKAAGMDGVERQLREITGTAWSPDRMVKASTDLNGQLIALEIDPRAYRTSDPEVLRAAVLAAARDAAARATGQAEALLDGILPADLRRMAGVGRAGEEVLWPTR